MRGNVRLSDFDFDLPEELIALHPATPRRAARMLVREGGETTLATAADLARFLRPGDLLVFNNTRVIPAHLEGRRLRGTLEARIEVTLIAEDAGTWTALARPARKLAPGDRIAFEAGLGAEVLDRDGAEVRLRFDTDGTAALMEKLQAAGSLPLPPYIAGRRGYEAADKERYQTIFAERDGAVDNINLGDETVNDRDRWGVRLQGPICHSLHYQFILPKIIFVNLEDL